MKRVLEVVGGGIPCWEGRWKVLERIEEVGLLDMAQMRIPQSQPEMRDLTVQTVNSGLNFDTMEEDGVV